MRNQAAQSHLSPRERGVVEVVKELKSLPFGVGFLIPGERNIIRGYVIGI